MRNGPEFEGYILVPSSQTLVLSLDLILLSYFFSKLKVKEMMTCKVKAPFLHEGKIIKVSQI